MRTIKVSINMAGVFASGTFLIVGAGVLFNDKSLDFDTVLYACQLGLMGSVVAGFLGYIMGAIFESAKMSSAKTNTHKKVKNPDLLIDDLLVEDLNKISEINENEEGSGTKDAV